MKPPRRRGSADVAPILKAIVRTTARLCDASYAHLHLVDGARLRIAAKHGKLPGSPSVGGSFPLTRGSVAGRAVIERRTVHVRDLKATAKSQYKDAVVFQRAVGLRTMLGTPLLRDGQAVGALVVLRRTVRPFTSHQIALLKTFAEQAAIALENARLARELQDSNRELTDSLAQRTATAEILRVISSSPTDAQPVFDAIVSSARRLLDGFSAGVYRRVGDEIHLAAYTSTTPPGDAALRNTYPRRIGDFSFPGEAMRTRATVVSSDVEADPRLSNEARSSIRERGFRSGVWVPMLRDGAAIGGIGVTRRDAGAFADEQIALLQTFADQAVVAIENVRLFRELEARNDELTEALEQQTATAEILRVISSSPTDIRPVLETVVRAAARFCDAPDVAIVRVDGGVLRGAAAVGPFGEEMTRRAGGVEALEFPITKESVTGRAVVERRTVHVHDLAAEPEDEFPVGRELQRRFGHRTLLATPLLREGVPIGAIILFRTEVDPFSDKQLQLLQTFADQAVIAIENVRLFTELEARNRDLTEALEQQTATSEILRVISRSQTDVQPVFDTIVRSAVRLCDGLFSALFQFDGELIHQVAQHNFTPEALEEVRRVYPARPSRSHGSARAILEGAIVHIPDVELDPDYQRKELPRAVGLRSGLYVPMMREGAPVGVIMVARATPGFFSDSEVELLKTFADQAVIAIENVRLFTELEARNRDLTESLEQQTATSEILRVISSSPTDLQPVFDIIVESATKLCGAEVSAVTRFDGEWIEMKSVYGSTSAGADALRRVFPMRPSGSAAAARAIRDCAIAHVPDVLDDAAYGIQDAAVASGFRAALGVPMVREGRAIGSIAVGRAEAGEFGERQIKLLCTFADQAVIAIENVRLFTELQASNRDLTTALDQQTATSDILRVISQSQTDVQPVFDAILASAVRLLRAHSGALILLEGDQIELAALTSTDESGDAVLRAAFPQARHSDWPPAQAIRGRAPINIADAHTDPRVAETQHANARIRGYQSIAAVPLLRHEEAVGAIAVTRRESGGFSDDEIALLQTFADQAVIAIENVRLFTELEDRNRDLTESLEQQTATSEILQVISSSPTDLQPVFDIIAESAVKLCGAEVGLVTRLEGEWVDVKAVYGTTAAGLDAIRRVYPMRPSGAAAGARAIQDCAIAHIPDVLAEKGYGVQQAAVTAGFRAALGVPMVREGRAIGSIAIGRADAGEFSERQIKLLCTFADQAVIAIENVRLFKELQARTSELSRSVDQLTALGEISRAVSSTLDVETVLQTIVSRATQLAGADGCAIYEYDEATEAFHIRATHNLDPGLVETLRATPLRKGEGAMGRAAETREPTQVADIAAPGAYQSHIRETLLGAGYRALLSVPLLREGEVIGSLSLNRHAPGEFPAEAVEVLKTFATQSALAIQNARLFREIADKSRQLEAASRHKSEFLANMSHELRTPLNAIIGFSEVLNERMFGELNDKQAEYLRDIHASGTHLLSLINDILDLSKIEAGRMELERTDFSLPAAIDSALTLVRERATRRGITLRAAIDEGVGEVSGDERKIRQVLLNLLSNAIKFTPEGGRIEVTAVPAGGAVEVAVRDTGVGIAPEDQEAVFEEFRQVGASAAKQEGTGLGLALCRKFIELHGGKIWVTSQVGAGSTFTFRLPVRQ